MAGLGPHARSRRLLDLSRCLFPLVPAPRTATLEDETYAVTESYLEQHWFSATMEREGLAFTFEGWCYPLEAYAGALEAAGLLIEAMREPADPDGGRWARVPMFLMWRAVKGR